MDADGTVTGETEETNTGIFAIGLRSASSNVQNLGQDAASQRQLQNYNTPGTGRFDFGNSSESTDPVTLKSWFTLSQRFTPPAPGARATISFGLPQTVRPGYFLLGIRLNGRKSAFTCYAGRQTEDIDATFDQSLPMPVALARAAIDEHTFTLHATVKVG